MKVKMYIITDADTGEEVFINDDHLVLIETNKTVKGYCTVHTTVKRYSVKANSIPEVLAKSAVRCTELASRALSNGVRDGIADILSSLEE